MPKKKSISYAEAQDSMNKTEMKAFHKEICEYFEANGWKTTLSQYQMSPKQLSPVVEATRAKLKAQADKEKAERRKARADKRAAKKAPKKAAKKVTKKASSEAPKRRGRPPGSKNKTTKRKTTRRKSAATALPGSLASADVLTYLLDYRAKAGAGASIDSLIADLAAEVVAA